MPGIGGMTGRAADAQHCGEHEHEAPVRYPHRHRRDGVSGLVQRAVGEGSGVEVHGRHVGAHMHGRAGFGQSGRGGVEHFLRVGYVVAHPQGDAAGEEGQRTVALENMDGPIGVLGENRGGGERAGVRAADDGDCGHECSFACGHGV